MGHPPINLESPRTRHTLWTGIGIYVLHILVGSVGVFIVGLLLAVALESVSSPSVEGAVFEGPVFFGQIGLGFLAGFFLNRHLRSKSGVWTWVLPAVWPGSAIPSAFGSLYGPNGWGVLFGTKCRPDCLDQLITVCPFYASVAYSLGSWAALGAPFESRVSTIDAGEEGPHLWLRRIPGIFLYSVGVIIGVLIVTVVVVLSAMLVSHPLGMMTRNIFGRPYYFGQVVVALVGGYLVNMRLKSNLARAVWVFPAIWLLILIISRVHFTGWTATLTETWFEFFSSKCISLSHPCWQQLYGTGPFLVAVAYSMDAWIATIRSTQ